MTFDRHDSKAYQQYREKIAETAKLREQLEKIAVDSRATGDLGAAQSLLAELTLKTKELGSIRDTLGAEGIFLAKYGYEHINDHTALFVLPKGSSRIAILQEADELVRQREQKLISRRTLYDWERDERFTREVATSTQLWIDGHVEGSADNSRAEQESLVAAKGLTLPSLEDLAVAFALHWVATAQPLFGWYQDRVGKIWDYTYTVGITGGSLFYKPDGLGGTTKVSQVANRAVTVAGCRFT